MSARYDGIFPGNDLRDIQTLQAPVPLLSTPSDALTVSLSPSKKQRQLKQSSNPRATHEPGNPLH